MLAMEKNRAGSERVGGLVATSAAELPIYKNWLLTQISKKHCWHWLTSPETRANIDVERRQRFFFGCWHSADTLLTTVGCENRVKHLL